MELTREQAMERLKAWDSETDRAKAGSHFAFTRGEANDLIAILERATKAEKQLAFAEHELILADMYSDWRAQVSDEDYEGIEDPDKAQVTP